MIQKVRVKTIEASYVIICIQGNFILLIIILYSPVDRVKVMYYLRVLRQVIMRLWLSLLIHYFI